MEDQRYYEVQTHWGWFRLDERAYRDYLAGNLWICWEPGKRRQPQREELPVSISEEAAALRERAEREGVLAVAETFSAALELPMPCVARLRDLGIEELNLSVRAMNALRRAGIATCGALRDLMESGRGLLGLRNLGLKSAKEIRTAFLTECYARLRPVEKAEYWQGLLGRPDLPQ